MVETHLGVAVEESDGDPMDDGANIAARLEGVAKPGGIGLSEKACWQVKGRLDLAVSYLAPTQLKTIAEPVRAYSLHNREFDIHVPSAIWVRYRPLPLYHHGRGVRTLRRVQQERRPVNLSATPDGKCRGPGKAQRASWRTRRPPP
jgi:hypothetical protein